MLSHLHISNYALIDQTDIEFGSGMSVITGETGAGKSILLGALGLVLGQRADVQVLLDRDKKCVVEAEFNIDGADLETIFADNDAEYDPQTIIRREILPSGKSRAFVNDSPVNVAFLRQIAPRLIDIHSQHQNLLLSDDAFHLNIVDAVSGDSALLDAYSTLYKQYRALRTEEAKLLSDNEKMKRDYDYLLFQHNQFADAKIHSGEERELEAERERLEHAEEIKTELQFAVSALGDDEAVLAKLTLIEQRLSKIEKFISQDAAATERIETARIDLADLLKTLEQTSESVDYDPERLAQVAARLDVIYSLMQKHKAQTTEELLAAAQSISEKLNAITSFDDALDDIRRRIEQLTVEMRAAAAKLTTARQSVFSKITDYIASRLKEMGMPNARFVVAHNVVDEFMPTGTDSIRFLFAANKNGEPTDISRVASGGEMSRLMLAVKSLLSHSQQLPTIIFDEIDTGVSGEIADKMGRMMTEMAENMQVIAITHLPQVAAKGSFHYRVFKTDTDERTVSNIVRLNDAEREIEIAKMLSGAVVTEAALSNARELIRVNS